MSRIKEISVLENDIDQTSWTFYVDKNGEYIIDDKLEFLQGYREVNDFHMCGCYYKANVPFKIYNVKYQELDGKRIYESATRSISDMTYEAMKKKTPLLIAGGFSTYALGELGGIRRALGPDKKIGVIWLDAHADMETPDDIQSHILAGMPLATILGLGMEEWRKIGGLEEAIPGNQVILSDYHSRNPKTVESILRKIKQEHVDLVETEGFHDETVWKSHVAALSKKVDAIYLHVDVDILSTKYIPAYDYSLDENGMELETLIRGIKAVMATGKVIAYCVSNTYFGTNLSGQEVNNLTAMKLVGSGLESWKEYPDF